MPKRNRNTVSYEEAVTDVLQWLENEGETEDNDNVDMIIHGNEDDLSSSDESDENIDEEGFEDQNEPRFRPPRKLLTKHRLVHDIESAINEQSYDDLHYVNRQGNWETYWISWSKI